jgi:hypothetical protein
VGPRVAVDSVKRGAFIGPVGNETPILGLSSPTQPANYPTD